MGFMTMPLPANIFRERRLFLIRVFAFTHLAEELAHGRVCAIFALAFSRLTRCRWSSQSAVER
ncbi:hypothetical protein A7982_13308 [Minicystis rosea]|nr:hypothetical protein A7982_13308 [Minicystis rosea]